VARAEIANQSVRGLLLINGGGAVALLAFLQAIWGNNANLEKYVVAGIALFSSGVLITGFINVFRYHASLAFQAGNTRKFNIFWLLEFWSQPISLACFGIGMLVVVAGAWCQLG